MKHLPYGLYRRPYDKAENYPVLPNLATRGHSGYKAGYCGGRNHASNINNDMTSYKALLSRQQSGVHKKGRLDIEFCGEKKAVAIKKEGSGSPFVVVKGKITPDCRSVNQLINYRSTMLIGTLLSYYYCYYLHS